MLLLAVFSLTLFLGAFLLFSVEPMIAKMLLPYLGGAPAVWNTCMVFFQAVLLAGYGYAHFVSARFTVSGQAMAHLLAMGLAAVVLPVGISERALQWLPTETNPSGWLFGCLILSVGLPFFVLATTAPLLQRWFSWTDHSSAVDPYFLYAASNFGSLAALVSYPLFIEWALGLREQSVVWSAVYILFGGLVIASAVLAARRTGARVEESVRLVEPERTSAHPIVQRIRWVLLAFVPSSLMLGVTSYLTTDIASMPLLWAGPLALYLVSFIVAFGRRNFLVSSLMVRSLAVGAAGLTFLMVSEATEPAWLLISVHMIFFFLAAWVCHGRLAEERPPVSRLTEFYFWVSAGGVCGGMFNALLAPQLFSRVAEYPVAVILAYLVHWKEWMGEASELFARSDRAGWVLRVRWIGSRLVSSDFLLPAGLGLITVALVLGAPKLEGLNGQWQVGVIFGLPVIASYSLVDKPTRFGLALAAILLASLFYSGTHGRTLHAERNFFGVLRVTVDPSGTTRRLVHGNTVHGRQSTDPERQDEPLSYYHRGGPLGDIFRAFDARTNSVRVGVVGLGTGSILAYARPDQDWTFYEINPAVLSVASNHFTFLSRARARKVQCVLGDARLRLREAPELAFDLLIIDAFSSDSIPVHLITREALDLYMAKLAPGGILAFHISNRCLDLGPVLGDLAHQSKLVCRTSEDVNISSQDLSSGKEESQWVVLARDSADLGKLTRSSLWLPAKGRENAAVWTDDFSNILRAWRRE